MATTTTPTCVDRVLDRVVPCWFALRTLAGDGAAVERERRERAFRAAEMPMLLDGGAFLLVKGVDDADADSVPVSATSTSTSASETPPPPSAGGGGGGLTMASLAAVAEKNLVSLAANAAIASKTILQKAGATTSATPAKDEPILLRLVTPAPKSSVVDAANASLTERLSGFAESVAAIVSTAASSSTTTTSGGAMPEEPHRTTAVMWTSLALEQNRPRVAGKLSLHRVQLVKEKGTGFVMLDHNGVALLEVKVAGERAAQPSIEAGRWVRALQNALAVLAPQIEEEAAAVRGLSYRAKRMEELRLRDEERARQKAKLGPVGMAYTAKIMAARKSQKELAAENAAANRSDEATNLV